MVEIGNQTLKDMGSMPYITLKYKGKVLPMKSDKLCKETNGDCRAFINKYLKIKWI